MGERNSKRAYKLDLTIQKLEELKDKVIEEKNAIIDWIKSINKTDIRQIFIHRYIDNMNWIEVQVAMGYKHEDTARNKHDKFLKNFL